MDYGGVVMEVNFDRISIEEISKIFSRQLMSLPTGTVNLGIINKEGKNDKRWNLFKKR